MGLVIFCGIAALMTVISSIMAAIKNDWAQCSFFILLTLMNTSFAIIDYKNYIEKKENPSPIVVEAKSVQIDTLVTTKNTFESDTTYVVSYIK